MQISACCAGMVQSLHERTLCTIVCVNRKDIFMPNVVGIRFKDSGKTYYFDPAEVSPLDLGQSVIVETARGLEMARVAEIAHDVEESTIVGELKPVMRLAVPEDDARWKQLNSRQDELLRRCQEKIAEHELPMGLVKAEYSFDGSRLTFYFTADKRVDFRNLVRDLARTFRTRIELRQIGPRDEAKLLGGIGPCGRILCCATFLPDYARVSIKMAKDQDLPLNPAKISGVCGRLLCCLAYEHEQYIEMKAEMPRRGAWVQTPEGPGEVWSANVLRGTITVLLAATGVQEEFTPDKILESTQEVVATAKARNAEGITPVVRENKRGERRLLREEFESSDQLAALAALEDRPEDRATADDLGVAVRVPNRGREGGQGAGRDDRRGPPQQRPSGDRPNRPFNADRPPVAGTPVGRDDRRGPPQQRPSGDRPFIDRRPGADRPQGAERPQSDRPFGERRPQGDGAPRQGGDRPYVPNRPAPADAAPPAAPREGMELPEERRAGHPRPDSGRPSGERPPATDRPQSERPPRQGGDRPYVRPEQRDAEQVDRPQQPSTSQIPSPSDGGDDFSVPQTPPAAGGDTEQMRRRRRRPMGN